MTFSIYSNFDHFVEFFDLDNIAGVPSLTCTYTVFAPIHRFRQFGQYYRGTFSMYSNFVHFVEFVDFDDSEGYLLSRIQISSISSNSSISKNI